MILGVSGTGFFVSNAGHLVTANHVFTDVPVEATMFYAGNVPHNVVQPTDIEIVARNTQKDLLLGRVAQHPLPPLNFTMFHGDR